MGMSWYSDCMGMLFQIHLKTWDRYCYPYIVGMRKSVLMLHTMLVTAQGVAVCIQCMPVPHSMRVISQAV